MQKLNPITFRFIISTIFLFSFGTVLAQTKIQSIFTSVADAELTIRSVVLVPFADNLSGIYSKALSDEMRSLLSNDPQWTLVSLPANTAVKTPGLEDRPEDVKRLLKLSGADALFSGKITKGPRGLLFRMNLSVGASGQILLGEETMESTRFEIDRLKEVLRETLQKIRMRLPYRGVVLSRKSQQVTINFGKNQGLQDGMEIAAIQILQIQRHPKKKFLIGSEREILGKIKIFKADDNLSFGNVVFEKEPGVVTAGMKLITDDGVVYPDPITSSDGRKIDDLNHRDDKHIAFGEKPIEWLPEPPPQYGRVQLMAGLGQYAQSANFQSAGGITGSSSFAPLLSVAAEGWLNRDWFISFDIRQSAFSISNELPGSSPGRLNMSLSRTSVSGGRNFLLSNDFFGPKIQLSAGFGKFSARVDESTPIEFSNMEYGGLHFGFALSTDLGEDLDGKKSPWDFGAKLRCYWNPGVSESTASGSTKSVSVSDFGFLLGYRSRPNFRYIGEVGFEYYNSDFGSGGSRPDPVSSIAHRLTTALFGLEYSF